MKDKPKTIIVGNGLTGLTEAYISADMYKPPLNLIVSTQIKRIIEPHEKPSKMYSGMTMGRLESYSRLEEKRKRDKLDALLNASELLNKFNRKKHLATCAKNRRNRKSKKRK